LANNKIKETSINPQDLLKYRFQEVQTFVKKVIIAHSKLLTLYVGTSGQHKNSPRDFLTTALKKSKATSAISELTLYYYHYRTAKVQGYTSKFLTTMDDSLKGGSNTMVDDLEQLNDELPNDESPNSKRAVAAVAALNRMSNTFEEFVEHTKVLQVVVKKLADRQSQEMDTPEVHLEQYEAAVKKLQEIKNNDTLSEEQKEKMINIFKKRVDKLYSKLTEAED